MIKIVLTESTILMALVMKDKSTKEFLHRANQFLCQAMFILHCQCCKATKVNIYIA